jgi:hypothetical protein
MDIKNGKVLLIVCGIVVFLMIYTIGVFWDYFPPPEELWGNMFGDSFM